MTKDEWRLLGYGLLAAALMIAVLGPIFLYHISLPKIVGELICGAIVVGLFLFIRYRAGFRGRDLLKDGLDTKSDEQNEELKIRPPH